MTMTNEEAVRRIEALEKAVADANTRAQQAALDTAQAAQNAAAQSAASASALQSALERISALQSTAAGQQQLQVALDGVARVLCRAPDVRQEEVPLLVRRERQLGRSVRQRQSEDGLARRGEQLRSRNRRRKH